MKCANYGSAVTKAVRFCPGCGTSQSSYQENQDPPKSSGAAVGCFFIAAFAVVMIILFTYSTFRTSNLPESTTIKFIPVTPEELSALYRTNEVAADLKFKDKFVQMTGRVESIGKSLLDSPYIVVETESLPNIQCSFSKNAEVGIASLSKGSPVTIVGRVTGKLLHVQLQDCYLR